MVSTPRMNLAAIAMLLSAISSTLTAEHLFSRLNFKHSLLTSLFFAGGTALVGASRGGVALHSRAPRGWHLLCGAFIAMSFWMGAASQSKMSAEDFVVGRGAKLIPTMLVGATFFGKRYTRMDWLAAACAVGGLALILRNTVPAGNLKFEHPQRATGVLLLAGSLATDAAFTNLQEMIVRRYRSSAGELAVYGMGSAAVIFLVAIVVDSHALETALAVFASSTVLVWLVVFAATNVLGSAAMLIMVENKFGAANTAFVAAVSKSLSLVVLLVFVPRRVPLLALVGMALVLAAVFIAALVKVRELRECRLLLKIIMCVFVCALRCARMLQKWAAPAVKFKMNRF